MKTTWRWKMRMLLMRRMKMMIRFAWMKKRVLVVVVVAEVVWREAGSDARRNQVRVKLAAVLQAAYMHA
jgi:hypothetical protein